MDSFRNFDRLLVLYRVEGTVVNESPIRIGSGRSQTTFGPSDNPVLVMRRGEEYVPIIPGSSWKGLLRSEAERFVRSTEGLRGRYGDVWRACNVIELTADEYRREEEEENPCVVCRVFGNTGVAGHVRTFDSYPLGQYTLELISRVAIDRVTGGQSPGRLFNVEVVSPMTEWSFRMHVINIDMAEESPEREVMSYLVGRLTSGVQIGGGKSVGYGLVRLETDGLKVKEVRVREGKLQAEEFSGEEALRRLGVA